MKKTDKTALRKKSTEVLTGMGYFISAEKEVTFEDLEAEFPQIQGRQLGSLLSGIARTYIANKQIIIPIPQFGSRRKVWRLNKNLTKPELSELKNTIDEILAERR